ncbi:MAG: S46 family peptidase [Hyphomonadaceae bacterium]|nr:S46 family peptidase [Hyphomonadaceae bacterium]
MLHAAAAALPLLGAGAIAPATADEGMWTFDNFPTERMREDHGWAPDQAWLDRVMAATARMPGCSASNVSANGLMLTNHHCVIACVTALSSADANYIQDGFTARLREEELRCPGMTIDVLVSVTDITSAIDAATSSAPPEGFAAARDAEFARQERACAEGGQRCEVVTLYQGGRYALHAYRRFNDVRLVFVPEHRVAAFGGDADNFEFPRYCLDIAFLRLYENGVAAETPNHLSLNFEPPEEGDIVLVAGNPGRTSRLRAAAELAFERDVNLPWLIASLTEQRERLRAYADQGLDNARIASSALQGVENSLKGLTGRRDALVDPVGFAEVVARERDLQTRVRRNLASTREVGDAWGEVERAQAAFEGFFHAYQNLELRAGERSQLFAWARDIVRGGAERALPNGERLARYGDARLPALGAGLGAATPTVAAFEQVNLQFWLERLERDLGSRDPALAQRVLGGETPAALAERLSQSRLADRDFRMQLWEGGAEAVAASDDPMIVFVRAWDNAARQVRARFVAEVEAPVARAQERIARARFRAFGDERYPDATFSPRLSYGVVEGWTEPGGEEIGAFTYLDGLYERAAGAPPFELSQLWLDARPRLDGAVVYNISSSNDVIGGASGSPLLDREGRVVGVIFDNNMHALGGEYFYDGRLNRSVSVSASAIHLALSDVYGMQGLLAELRGS